MKITQVLIEYLVNKAVLICAWVLYRHYMTKVKVFQLWCASACSILYWENAY